MTAYFYGNFCDLSAKLAEQSSFVSIIFVFYFSNINCFKFQVCLLLYLLTVGIKKREDFSFRRLRSLQSRSNQTTAIRKTAKFDDF